ncbi:heme biosynthesis HemY N-terminal domain-containing protein [Acuticoccus sediminis]|uniref:heme biosynthesis HemY N-terminal domain-containing protein n=1 Tax=Acuticoccus sediminis TaxID=2184697 RepID=UPI001CFD5292|nr:heme biosynthesis HemY N-terminal domain-containing protein [Acuticoccus sediminis]
MIRLLAIIVVLGVAAAGAAWITDRPGRVDVQWMDHALYLSAGEALGLLGGGFVVLYVVIEIGRMLVSAPRRMARRAEERRTGRALQALGDGFLAVAAGDLAAATRAAQEAERAAPGAPLASLLAAQAAQMRGDRAGAEARFMAMAQQPETLIVGLRGLAMEAARAGDTAVEHAHARAANAAAPDIPWAAIAAFHAATAERDFAEALRLNDEALRHRLVDRSTWKRRKAVLLTALAGRADGDKEARRRAVEAHGLAKDLVPAAVLAARVLAPQNARRAQAVVQSTYRLAPHPELFAAALAIGDARGAAARLKRAQALAALRPEHIESALGVASAALAAREFGEARRMLAPFLSERPPQRVCVAMAEIEAADGSEGAVREWLARAVRAPRDPAWVADGVAYEEWDAISPVTGTLDAFAWRLPDGADTPAGPSIDLTALTRVLPPAPEPAAIAPPAETPGTAPAAAAPPSPERERTGAESRDTLAGPRASVPRAASPSPS